MGTGRFEQRRGRSAKKMGILGERRRDSGVCFSPAVGLAGGLGSCLVPCGVRNSPENSWEPGEPECFQHLRGGGWKDPGNGGDLAGVRGWWGDNPGSSDGSSGKAGTS